MMQKGDPYITMFSFYRAVWNADVV